jgi:protein-S-isoprenylcysteine O-methyltransferase Ste14
MMGWQGTPAGVISSAMDGRLLADGLLLLAWAVVGIDLVRASRAARVAPWRRAAAAVLLAAIVAAGWTLEAATGGRLAWHVGVALAGVAAAWLGVGLHLWARRTLGRAWSPIVAPSHDARLVEDGPYRLVRHPLYAAILLLGAGTALAHCSRATLAAAFGLAAGVALKRRAEDRALAERFGARWTAYATRVPALVPRVRPGTRP